MTSQPDTSARASTADGQAVAPSTDPLLVTVERAAAMLSVSRATLYLLLRDGSIASIRIRRNRRIAVSSLQTFIANQETPFLEAPAALNDRRSGEADDGR